uniref:Reverse transcriptase domain-containing protein n=1 Tax=Dendroctonus ponderosae TaxID=77166 RepID=A0AAR5P179_DENPD
MIGVGSDRCDPAFSPFLINLLMNKIIEEITSLNSVYRMNNRTISMVCYDDDAAILAKNHQQLNMDISIGKTKTMTIAKEPMRCTLVIDNTSIEQVMQFRSLGIEMSSAHDTDSKIKIYKTCARPIMTYGIEARKDTNKTKRMLRVAEMSLLMTIAGRTRRDRVRNIDIRAQSDVHDVVRWARQRRRERYSHVKRMTDDRLPRIVLEGKPAGTRPPGEPPKRWKDSWQSTSQETIPRQARNQYIN